MPFVRVRLGGLRGVVVDAGAPAGELFVRGLGKLRNEELREVLAGERARQAQVWTHDRGANDGEAAGFVVVLEAVGAGAREEGLERGGGVLARLHVRRGEKEGLRVAVPPLAQFGLDREPVAD